MSGSRYFPDESNVCEFGGLCDEEDMQPLIDVEASGPCLMRRARFVMSFVHIP
jgi:hypothetical protein